MEKYSHVFERFANFENMFGGYLLARRNKRYKKEVLYYSANLEDFLVTDLGRLKDRTYHTGTPHPFYEYYPKKRLIHSLPFNDRVINCAAYLQLWPIYSRSFYEHSYGSIPDKGTVKAVKQLQTWMRMVINSPYEWMLGKMDIARFFFRVPVNIQIQEMGRPLDDPAMMWFLETAIRCDGRAFGLPLDCTDVATAERIAGRGMQVGSLISQTCANVVLTPLDHYIKRVLHIPYYIRYMDDMVFLCPSKQQAWETTCAVDEFLRGYGLQLNNKTAVMPVRNGVEFIGRRIWADKVLIRKETSLRMKRHLAFVMEHYATGELPLEYCLQVFTSYMGLLKYTNCTALKQKLIDDFILVRNSDWYRNEASCYQSSGKQFEDYSFIDRIGGREPVCRVC